MHQGVVPRLPTHTWCVPSCGKTWTISFADSWTYQRKVRLFVLRRLPIQQPLERCCEPLNAGCGNAVLPVARIHSLSQQRAGHRPEAVFLHRRVQARRG